MDKITGWVDLAAELSPQLQGRAPAEQRRLVADFAGRCGLKPDTMRRMVRAYAYALVRIRSEDMQISDVSASYIAVEAHERLSRTSPEAAARIARAVLRGESGYRDVVKVSRNVVFDDEEDASELHALDWRQFSSSLYDKLYGSAPGSVSFNHSRKGYSTLAKRMKIDIEFDIEEYQRAVFLAPSFPISEGRDRPIEDHLARAFMSLAFYVETVFIVATKGEERSAKFFLDRCSRRYRKTLLNQFSLYVYDVSLKAFSRAWGAMR